MSRTKEITGITFLNHISDSRGMTAMKFLTEAYLAHNELRADITPCLQEPGRTAALIDKDGVLKDAVV